VTEDEDVMRDAGSPVPTHLLPVDPALSVGGRYRARVRSPSVGRQVRRTLRSRWDILLVIAVGGAVGSIARWGLGEAFSGRRQGSFPWATFIENITGSFALGVLMVFVLDVWAPSRYVRPFVGVGVLGGFTTFSTYALDTRELVVADRAPLAAVYLFGTLAAGLVAVWLGIALARLFVTRSIRRRQQ
jgi:fluoride exporter